MTSKTKLSALIGASVAASMAMTSPANADTNAFGFSDLGAGYNLSFLDNKGMEGACGEKEKGKEGSCGEKSKDGKCGEGKCGEGKAGEKDAMADKSKDGKCGEGKCGEGKKDAAEPQKDKK